MVVLAGGEAPGLRRVRHRLVAAGTTLLEAPDLVDPGVRDALERYAPQLLLSFFWPRRIPGWLLRLPTLGAYGTHPSLLPRHRGPDPYFWTLRDGDREAGVSLHRLEEAYDVGDVVAQRRLVVDARENAWSLARRLDTPALNLLAWAAKAAEGGEALPAEPQRGEPGRWARQPTDDDLRLDWKRPTAELLRLIRAAAPWPGATALLGKHPVEVLDAEPAAQPPPAALRPAEGYDLEGGLGVVCGDGALRITRAREDDVVLTTTGLRARVGLN